MEKSDDSHLLYEKKQRRNRITRFLHSFRHIILCNFIESNFDYPARILDIGCGPGQAFRSLKESQEFPVDYFGVDVRTDFIETANHRYQQSGGRFAVGDVTKPDFDFKGYDVIVALETFEHIPENKLVRVIERIAAARPKYLICSVPVEIGPSVAIKNTGSWVMGYRRNSGSIKQTFWASLYQLNRLPRHNTAHLGFNWIWLEQTLRHNMEILETRALPYSWIPKWLAPTVMFTCRPYKP